MLIRPALIKDSHHLALVHVISWREAYRGIVDQAHLDNLSIEDREARWIQILKRGGSETLLAESSGEVIGFSSYGHSRDSDAGENTGEVYAIYVAPAHWSQGVGASLWHKSLERLVDLGFSTATLWVLAANERAIRFYRRMGFELCRRSEKKVKIGGEELPEVRYEIALV